MSQGEFSFPVDPDFDARGRTPKGKARKKAKAVDPHPICCLCQPGPTCCGCGRRVGTKAGPLVAEGP